MKNKNLPNQKPWMNKGLPEVTEVYSSARANLTRPISHSKHKQWLEEHSRRMWQAMQSITLIKPLSTVPTTSSASLKFFYILFEQRNKETLPKADLPPDEQLLTLPTLDVCSFLSKVNAQRADPDGIPSCVLKDYAQQLARVFTDNFNLSLAQAVVPTSIKTTSIVSVPKHSTATAQNGFHSVAFNPSLPSDSRNWFCHT